MNCKVNVVIRTEASGPIWQPGIEVCKELNTWTVLLSSRSALWVEDFIEGSLRLSTEHHQSAHSRSWHFFTKDSFRNSKENSHHIHITSHHSTSSVLWMSRLLQNATTLKLSQLTKDSLSLSQGFTHPQHREVLCNLCEGSGTLF